MAYTYMMKVFDSSLANTRTVNDTTATTVQQAGGAIRVAASTSSAEVCIVAYATETVSSGLTIPVTQVYKCASAATAFTVVGYLPMWCEASLPFYSAGGFPSNSISAYSKYFCLLANKSQDNNTTDVDADGNPDGYDSIANSVVLVCLNWEPSGTNTPFLFIPACVMDVYTSPMKQTQTNLPSGACGGAPGQPPHRPTVHPGNSSRYLMAHLETSEVPSLAVPALGSASTPLCRAYLDDVTLGDPNAISFAGDCLAGGYVALNDNYLPSEAGFMNVPSCFPVTSTTGGTIAAGTYNYIALFKMMDNNGKVHTSRTSRPSSVTTTGSTSSVTIKVPAPVVTGKNFPWSNSQCQVRVYRTKAGGTQYFECLRASVQTAAATPILTESVITVGVDIYPDATIGGNPLCTRQPGTQGTVLDRYHSLRSDFAVRHKDRVFYARKSTVYFSSFDVDGEAPWFNPAFSFTVPGGGDITGLASMDGTLVVFKADSVYLVDGDGPPENGGNGTEFSPPRKMFTPYGCVDKRTLLQVPEGIMYRSSRGIEFMNRKFAFSFIGSEIQRTVDLNPYNHCAGYDPTWSRALFSLAPSSSTAGKVLSYDFINSAWTTHTYYRNSAGSQVAKNPVAICAADNISRKTFMVIPGITSVDELVYEDVSKGNDAYLSGDEGRVPYTITLGWVRGQSMEDSIRISDYVVTGFRNGPFGLTGDFAYNYDRATYNTGATFAAAATALVPVRLEFQPGKESVQSMKARFVTVPTAGSTARQLDVTGITVRVGVRGPGVKLPVAQKG